MIVAVLPVRVLEAPSSDAPPSGYHVTLVMFSGCWGHRRSSGGGRLGGRSRRGWLCRRNWRGYRNCGRYDRRSVDTTDVAVDDAPRLALHLHDVCRAECLAEVVGPTGLALHRGITGVRTRRAGPAHPDPKGKHGADDRHECDGVAVRLHWASSSALNLRELSTSRPIRPGRENWAS